MVPHVAQPANRTVSVAVSRGPKRNAAQISGAGAAGVAVIGAVLSAPEPETAARALRVAFAPA